MKAEGHHYIAESVGLPLLQEVFGKDKKSLQAFYLGNWLTDVSQLVDPVAFSMPKEKLAHFVTTMKREFGQIIEELASSVYNKGPGFLQAIIQGDAKPLIATSKAFEDGLDSIKKELNELLDHFVEAQDPTFSPERGSLLGRFMRGNFFIVGYFKFVHPEYSEDGNPRMDFEAFKEVFGNYNGPTAPGEISPKDSPGAFTQYYPHEHLDRPEVLSHLNKGGVEPVYAPGFQMPGIPFQLAPGTKAGTRSTNKPKEWMEPDMYSYLRDDMEMTAGLLSEVDREMKQFISKFKKKETIAWNDKDPKWHQTLAKFGHALHQVEDFFAHSNWAELFAVSKGEKYVDDLLNVLPEGIAEKNTAYGKNTFNVLEELEAGIDRRCTIFHKRLKRHLTIPLTSWESYPEEDWVVTGFFDIKDTCLSVLHLIFDDRQHPINKAYDRYKSVKEALQKPKTLLYDAQKMIHHTSGFITDPQQALKDKENDLAKSLKEKFGTDVNKLMLPSVSEQIAAQVLKESPLFSSVRDERVKSEFINLVVLATRVNQGAKSAYSLYKVISTLYSFFKGPRKWLEKILLDTVFATIKDQIAELFWFHVQTRVYDRFGADRIGCHSLIAKDHGSEPLYEQAKNCAMAVHWYIVNTMLRWHTEEDAKFIDWLELLEYFLRNPLVKESREVGFLEGYVIHVVKYKEQLDSDDPLKSLTKLYGKTSYKQPFKWEYIADANFATKGLSIPAKQMIINNALRNSAWGIKVKPPNYAFKAGLPLLIPFQKLPILFYKERKSEMTWAEKVFEKGWKVFAGYEDPEEEKTMAPLKHHQLVEITEKELVEIIEKGKRMRFEARKRYSPRALGD